MLSNIVLFAGIDSANNAFGLWETDGTATGTFELTTSGGNTVPGTPAISGEALYGFLPDPPWSLDLTVFNDEVLFVGRSTVTNYGLWTTDGTGAGTKELTGIAGANSAGLLAAAATKTNSPDFTLYNGEVLFNGRDNAATPLQSLWTTNGTAPGTHEVTGINGAATTGVNPIDMTVFNGSVLFNGVDGAGHQGLWITNGTGVGTQELTVGSTASATGIDPTDMTVLNGEVLFNGVDANGLSGLWAWNGTGATELVPGGGTSSTKGLNPTDMTVFGNEVLFNGLDQNDDPQLWVTDGTISGTHQLTGVGVTGANPVANASGIAPSDLTVYDGEVLFSGRDTTGHQQLWETNGTVAGTQEVTTAANGFRQGLNPSNMEVYDNEVLFQGLDSNGYFHTLWATDGTAPGTYEVVPPGSANTYSSSFSPGDLTAIDLTSIGGPDLTAGAKASYVAGAPAVTLDPGLTISDPESPTLTEATVSIAAGFLSGDVLSVGSSQTGITSGYDATTGVLTLSGTVSLAAYQAELDSVAFASTSSANPSRTIAWSVKDGSGTSASATSASSSVSVFVSNPDLDIILQNTSGQLALWQTDGATLSAAILLGPNPGPSWSEEATGAFFSGDTSDILWQNTSGAVAVWQMQNDALVSADAVANPGRIGTWSGLATSTTTAIPMCWSGTTTARSGSGHERQHNQQSGRDR